MKVKLFIILSLFIILILVLIIYLYKQSEPSLIQHIGKNLYTITYDTVEKIPQPTSLYTINNDVYLTTKKGKLYKNKKEIYDFSKKVNDFESQSEGGLLCTLIRNNKLYVTYTVKSKDKNYAVDLILARYTINNDKITYDNTILSIPCPELYHHAGTIHFHDNHIYLSVGDGGPQRDPKGNAQNPKLYLGKILRIDINTYKVKITAMGLRNPWGFSISSLGLFVGDVGNSTVEAVYLLPNLNPEIPYNLGWNYFEGSSHKLFNHNKLPKEFYPPIFEYKTSREYGRAVIGGYYTGNMYVFGDHLGFIRILQYNKNYWEQVGITRIPDKRIYNLGYDGKNIFVLANDSLMKLKITKGT